jgi:hypothetical protein
MRRLMTFVVYNRVNFCLHPTKTCGEEVVQINTFSTSSPYRGKGQFHGLTALYPGRRPPVSIGQAAG